MSLTIYESELLTEYERTIERGLNTFIDVGGAMLAIRDKRLYRQNYATFEEYCEQRWDFRWRRAYQLMDAAQAVSNLHNCTDLPANEAQARPLTSLPADEQREVWQEAVDTAPDGNITARHVQEVVDRHNGNGNQPAPDPTEESESDPAPQDSGDKLANLMTSNTPEWYTPADIIERVHDVLGYIALDPCSTAEANDVVDAQRFFAVEDDGLSARWHAPTIYMNPPYGSEIGAWVEKLCQTVNNYPGGWCRAIALVPARTDTQWFQMFRDYPRCFIVGRLKFWGPDDSGNSATFPSAVIGINVDLEAFINAFGDMGDIYERVGG